MTITSGQFGEVDIRVGRVVSADEFPEARRPSFRLGIDFGPLGLKHSCAALRLWYAKEELIGRLVVAVVNLPPRQVATMMSEVLVLGALEQDGRVVLLKPDDDCAPGARIA